MAANVHENFSKTSIYHRQQPQKVKGTFVRPYWGVKVSVLIFGAGDTTIFNITFSPQALWFFGKMNKLKT